MSATALPLTVPTAPVARVRGAGIRRRGFFQGTDGLTRRERMESAAQYRADAGRHPALDDKTELNRLRAMRRGR